MILNLVERPIVYVLNLVASFWGFVSFYPWYLLYGAKQRHDEVQARATVSRDPSSSYRCVEHYQNILRTPVNAVYTLDKLFRNTVSSHGSKKCLGTRELFSSENEMQANGRVFNKVVLGNYNWLSYNEVLTKVESFGCGLLALGQRTKQNVVIFADTRAEWMIAAQSCFSYNFPVVTLYATLGEEAIVYGINQAEVEVVITDGHLLPKLQTVAGQLTNIKTIIYIGDVNLSGLSVFPSHVKVLSIAEVERIGSRSQNISQSRIPPCPEDTAVIMYTSGSTGLPKGVIISHANLMATIAGMTDRVRNKSNDVYIGYLPLAHVLELSAELVMLSQGSSIGYSSPLTLADQSSKIKKGSKGDVGVLKPTLMAAVP
ncbi:long-chain-fatty-acid-- ligase 4-like, partial [Paramuricea clavata]